MSKIGTGEGAQAYGRGLYAAESPKVSGRGGEYDAQFTARNLGKVDLTMQENAILRHMHPEASDMDVLDKILREGRVGKDANGVPDFDQAEAAIKRIRDNKAHIYEVEIRVKPDELLDWDKPISEQPKKIQDAMRAIGPDRALFNNKTKIQKFIAGAEDQDNRISGQDMWRASFGNGEGGADGAERLKAAGVKGIRYLDGDSRSRGRGTYNYVVFDDKLITILKKYGIPMTAGAGGAMMVAGQDMPPEFAAQIGGT
jgi:hypothetical protein